MRKIAHFGTFDVENYGDLLFPLVLERRLARLDLGVIHVSPVGGAPVWGDCVATVSVEEMMNDEFGHQSSLVAVVVGGGHIIHANPTRLPFYDRGGLDSWLAYPSLWLAPSYLAASRKISLWWNGPGVPSAFSERDAELLRWATEAGDYLAVRDRYSRELLQKAGVARPVEVIPDTALDVSHLWTPQELDRAYEQTFAELGAAVPDRAIALHLNGRYVTEDPDTLAMRLGRICRSRDAEAVLVAIGPCHGDDKLAQEIAGRIDVPAHVVSRPKSLRQVAACIGRAEAYVGSSLHGMITAFSFGVPGLIVASEEKAGFRKFSGFLEQLGLTSHLSASWCETEAVLSRMPERGSSTWKGLRAQADAALERHWERVGSLLDGQSDGRQEREARQRRALERLERLDGGRLSVHPTMRGIVVDRAERLVLQAAETAARKEQELARLRGLAADTAEAANRRERELARVEPLIAEAREAANRKRHEVVEITGLFERLESAVNELLNSRPWRIGVRLHGISRRARRKAPIPRVPGIFPDLFRRFHRWKEGLCQNEGFRVQGSGFSTFASTSGRQSGRETCLVENTVALPSDILNPEPRTLNPFCQTLTAGLVICVHNALDDVRSCLQSVLEHTDRKHPIYLVDDGSDAECRDYLAALRERHCQVSLIRNEQAGGYTKAANQGLRAAKEDYAVLLNSDTIVTPGWLDGLIECGQSDPRIGIVGPLSNAASWQSIPERFGAAGDWAVNPLPSGWAVEDMAQALRAASLKRFPRVPILNGFCLAIKRAVIESVGYLDEEAFPFGYGEENDFCLRAGALGHQLAVADHVYVYHAKSRSYSHERRKVLAEQGGEALARKHGKDCVKTCVDALRSDPRLAETRRRFLHHLLTQVPASQCHQPRILFLLPVGGGGGGAHSVVQESSGMRRIGVDVQVAVRKKHRENYRANYPQLPAAEELFFFYQSEAELLSYARGFDIVIATIWNSTELVRTVVDKDPAIMPAYYVQDYEPLFYREGCSRWKGARRSYTCIAGMVLFAKTDWIRREVRQQHGVEVWKVSPSLDHEVYYPRFRQGETDRAVRVSAMIRPGTPRRGAARTMRVLKRLQRELESGVEIHLFGCQPGDFSGHGLQSDYPFQDHGVLVREQVADLLRRSDVFVDLSDYQAFGRTGLEAMACGCAVILPQKGGADEYAVDGANAVLANTEDEDHCYAVLRDLVQDGDLRERIRSEGLRKATEYSIHRAAVSELMVLNTRLAEHRGGPMPAGARPREAA